MPFMRFPNPFRPPIVGLDVGTDAVKAVVLKKLRNGWALVGATEVPMPDSGTSDPDATADVLKQVFDTLRLRRARVATALAGQSAIVKRLSLPAMSDAELAEAIPWEAEQYIPFDLADVQLDYQVMNGADASGKESLARTTTDVLLVAAKRDKIEERTDVIIRSGREPVVLDLEAFALVNAYEANHPDRSEPLTVLVHAGRTSTIVCLLERGQLAFTRDIALGGQSHSEALMRDLNVDALVAERLKFPTRPLLPGVTVDQVRAVLRDVSSQLVTEISKTIDFYRATAPIERVSRIVLSGGACAADSLAELLGAEFDAPVEVFDPFRAIERRRAEAGGVTGPAFAVAVGLAMREGGAA
jgi:type IV pilus assembly protein PilM